MSTVTSLGFAITSAFDPSGLTAARRDIERFRADLESMSDDRISVEVGLRGVQEAQAEVEEISRNREAVVSVVAHTQDALFDIEAVAENRDLTLNVEADTENALFSIESLTRPRTARIELSVETAAAIAEMEEAAQNRTSHVRVELDGGTTALARIHEIARDRIVAIRAMVDTSSATNGLSEMGRTGHLVIAGLLAGFLALGAAATAVGAILMTALGGGVVGAGLAVIAINKKMEESQRKAQQAAQDQADTAKTALVDAYKNVSDTASKGAQSITDANRGVSNAQRDVSDTARQGAETVRSASAQSVAANKNVEDSQKAVNQSYKDARRDLEDLQLQSSQTGDNIESARIALDRARERQSQLGSKGPISGLDVREAINNTALAQDHLNETIARSKRTNEDANDATAKGIEGSDKVVKAKDNESQARQKAHEAELNVAKTQQQAAENNRKAQESLSVATQRAAQAQKEASDNNVKAAQQLTEAQKKAAESQTNLNKVIEKGTTGIQAFVKELAAMAAPLKGPAHEAMESLKNQMKELAPAVSGAFAASAPLIQPFLDSLTGMARSALPGVTVALNGMKPTIEGFRDGMSGLASGLGSMFADMTPGAKGMGDAWRVIGTEFGRFLDLWGKFVGKTAGDGAKTLNSMLKGVNDLTSGLLDGLGGAMKNMAGGPSMISEEFKIMGDALRTFLPILGEVTHIMSSVLVPVMSALHPVMTALVMVWMAYKVVMLASKVAMVLYTGVLAAWHAAVAIGTAAQWALNTAMSANVVGIIVIAVAALVAGIVYLATKTQFFQTVWHAVWGFCKMVFDATLNWIKETWGNTLNWIVGAWQRVSGVFMGLWNGYWNAIKDAAQFVWDTIKGAWQAFWDGIKAIWDTVSGIYSAAWQAFWDGIKSVASSVWDAIVNAFHDFGDKLHAGFQGIVDMAKKVWDGIREIFRDPINAVIHMANDTIGKVAGFHMDDAKFADGGHVRGAGGPRDDAISAKLSNGEFVANAQATSKNLDVLHHINNGGMAVPAFADGGLVGDSKNSSATSPAVDRALGWASGLNGRPYNDQGWLDCSGLASGLYDQLLGRSPKREFTTVSNFRSLGFVPGDGGIMDIGVTPLPGDSGHMAITLGGHKIESSGSNGIRVDGPARGANDGQFQDHYFLPGQFFNPTYTGPRANGKGDGSNPSVLSSIGSAVGGVAGKVFGGARELISDLFQKLTDPVLGLIPDPAPGTGKPFGSFPKAMATYGRDQLSNLIKGHESANSSSNVPMGGSIPTGQHLDVIDQALALTRTPPPGSKAAWESGMDTLIRRESGWNSAAINLTDSNAKAGIPSKGLAQTIDPTFKSHAVPGHTNIWEPVDNVAASINYIKSRYGDISNVQQANANLPARGYAAGTRSALPGLALVGEKGPEVVNFKGGEEVTPLSQLGDRAKTAATGFGNSAAAAGQSFAQANVSQLTGDLGMDTSGSGFIPQLFTQSFNYGQQLASYAEQKQGIFASPAPAPAADPAAKAKPGGGETHNHYHAEDVTSAFKLQLQHTKHAAMGFDPWGAL